MSKGAGNFEEASAGRDPGDDGLQPASDELLHGAFEALRELVQAYAEENKQLRAGLKASRLYMLVLTFALVASSLARLWP